MRAAAVVLAASTLAGCASTGAVPSPFPRAGGVSGSSPSPASRGNPDSQAIVRTALSLRGAPYRPGGADPSGFDCSGFVSYVLGRQGEDVPRTVSEQYRLGRRISRASVRPGDLVFFRTGRRGASHVGIAISGDAFVHAPATTGVVRVESLASPYWRSRFVGGRRLR